MGGVGPGRVLRGELLGPRLQLLLQLLQTQPQVENLLFHRAVRQGPPVLGSPRTLRCGGQQRQGLGGLR